MQRAPNNETAWVFPVLHSLCCGKKHQCATEKNQEAGQRQNRCHRRPVFYGISPYIGQEAKPTLPTARESLLDQKATVIPEIANA